MCPGGGVECAARDGFHLREADLLIEIVDPRTARPVGDGTYGEVLVTTLSLARKSRFNRHNQYNINEVQNWKHCFNWCFWV